MGESPTTFAFSTVLSFWVCPRTVKIFLLLFYLLHCMRKDTRLPNLHDFTVCIPERGSMGMRLIVMLVISDDANSDSWARLRATTKKVTLILLMAARTIVLLKSSVILSFILYHWPICNPILTITHMYKALVLPCMEIVFWLLNWQQCLMFAKNWQQLVSRSCWRQYCPVSTTSTRYQ